MSTTDSSTQQPSSPPCLACQNHPNLDLIPKHKKRPSIFGVLVSKLNTTTSTSIATTPTTENNSNRCSVCKRRLSKSIFYSTITNHIDEDKQQLSPSTQNFSSTSLTSSKLLHDHGQLLLRTKRRRSLPSLFHSLFDFDHHEKHHLNNKQIQHRPSFSSILTHTLFDTVTNEQQQPTSIAIIKQTSTTSYSSISLSESDDSEVNHNNQSFQRKSVTYDDSSQLTEKIRIDAEENGRIKDEYDKEIILDKDISSSDLNNMNTDESTNEYNPNQIFLHPPEEKTRSLLVNVFRTRRSNVTLGSNETNMAGKQFSVSVINLTTSTGSNRNHSTSSMSNDSTHVNHLDQRKHALSEENLPTTTDGTYIYFINVNGQNFRESLKYSDLSENTTLREILVQLFEKYQLNIERCNICLRSAPTLPLSLDQPVKHLLLDDLVVTEKENGLTSCSRMNHRALEKTSVGKERNDKRNSTGSAILIATSKSTSIANKRLSSQCMVPENDDTFSTNNNNNNYNQEFKSINPQQHVKLSKTIRSGLFTGSIFTRDVSDSSNERPESNLAFVRRKCDEWLIHGLPKLAQLQNYNVQIEERDLKIEKEWQPFLNEQAKSFMSESIKLQQEAIYEMLSTEVSYIRQILTMTDIFMTSVMILKSSQRDGLLNDIDMDKLFSNIQDVLKANLTFWKDILLPIKIKLEQTGCAMNPSHLKQGFLKFDIYFQSYLHYVLDQKTSAEYFKQKLAKDDLFQYLITWIEANFTNRLSFPDLTIKPLQRLTQYKLLLEAIQKRTQDNQQRNDLYEMIQNVASFVNRVNSKLHSQEQEERVRQICDRIGPYEYVSAPPEITSILQEYNRDSCSHRLDLLRDMPLFVRGYRRQIIQQGPMKMKDAKNSQDVYCYLFTDMFLITKAAKRSGTINSSSSTASSLSSITNDGQSSRSASATSNKILKPPIRIDRIDVREYDRRGSNNEPNTASFVIVVFSEYNLIECGYLFQTNLSKQWIENIRSTKSNFQLLMEESKMKLQNAHNHSIINSNPTSSSSTISLTTSNSIPPTIHQSLPSLSSTSEISLDLSAVKHDVASLDSSSIEEPVISNIIESERRSSKIESDVFKTVEQARRNSRTDHKNYGRYFTADGTGTHVPNPSSSSSSSSSINPSSMKSTPSTAIIKRMSWNNEPIKTNDSTTIPTNDLSNTNSFRSVHSSSGVSSTGSFLFSADEESLVTTTSSSIPALVPSVTNKIDDITDELDEIDGKSSSSTVIGTDDYEHLSNPISSHRQNILLTEIPVDLMNSDMIDQLNSPHLVSRLSSSSTNTVTSSNESTTPNNTHASSPESSLRRTPFPSVKKRHQTHTHHRSALGHHQHQQPAFRRHRIFDENDLRSSTHTIVYDSSKVNNTSSIPIPIRRTVPSSDEQHNTLSSSFAGSGNESDYDNNQTSNNYANISRYTSSSSRTNKIPVNDFNQSDELTRTDDLLLGDQNEIVLNNNSNIHSTIHNPDDDEIDSTEARVDLSDDNDDDIRMTSNNNLQSDNQTISSTNSIQSTSSQQIATKLDNNTPTNIIDYRKDPVTARKLFDIRSHLLLNTTLDATEV